MARDIGKLTKRVAELEAAIDEIREAWAYYHSVGGAVSRDEQIHAINVTRRAVEKVWRPRR